MCNSLLRNQENFMITTEKIKKDSAEELLESWKKAVEERTDGNTVPTPKNIGWPYSGYYYPKYPYRHFCPNCGYCPHCGRGRDFYPTYEITW